jgi:hypothetical protein
MVIKREKGGGETSTLPSCGWVGGGGWGWGGTRKNNNTKSHLKPLEERRRKKEYSNISQSKTQIKLFN